MYFKILIFCKDSFGDDLEVTGDITFIMDGVKEAWKKKKSTPSVMNERIIRYFPDPRFEPVTLNSFVGNNMLKLEVGWRLQIKLVPFILLLCNL